MRMKLAHDRLDLLATFLRVAETGSLSKAARLLGITQPTASRRLIGRASIGLQARTENDRELFLDR